MLIFALLLCAIRLPVLSGVKAKPLPTQPIPLPQEPEPDNEGDAVRHAYATRSIELGVDVARFSSRRVLTPTGFCQNLHSPRSNGEPRSLRYWARQSFDKLFLSGLTTGNQAYQWLAYLIQAPCLRLISVYAGEPKPTGYQFQ